jgi:hypothetical protein
MYSPGRAARARPCLPHVLSTAASEREQAGLAEQLRHRTLAVVAVPLRFAEPVHRPVAAGGEAVQRHRHVVDGRAAIGHRPPVAIEERDLAFEAVGTVGRGCET